MFKKGKQDSIKSLLEGYEKLDKANIKAGEGVLIDNVIKGHSEDNGDFVYITGSYNGQPVFVSVPAASLDDFIKIDEMDLNQIKRDGLHFYVESCTSKKGRQYFIAWIDD